MDVMKRGYFGQAESILENKYANPDNPDLTYFGLSLRSLQTESVLLHYATRQYTPGLLLLHFTRLTQRDLKEITKAILTIELYKKSTQIITLRRDEVLLAIHINAYLKVKI